MPFFCTRHSPSICVPWLANWLIDLWSPIKYPCCHSRMLAQSLFLVLEKASGHVKWKLEYYLCLGDHFLLLTHMQGFNHT